MEEFDEEMDVPMPSAAEIVERRAFTTSGPRSRSLEQDLRVSSVMAIVAFCLPLLSAEGPDLLAASAKSPPDREMVFGESEATNPRERICSASADVRIGRGKLIRRLFVPGPSTRKFVRPETACLDCRCSERVNSGKLPAAVSYGSSVSAKAQSAGCWSGTEGGSGDEGLRLRRWCCWTEVRGVELVGFQRREAEGRPLRGDAILVLLLVLRKGEVRRFVLWGGRAAVSRCSSWFSAATAVAASSVAEAGERFG